jgi:uncharacterized SAM-binding protein YcdF (DUF218 family)
MFFFLSKAAGSLTVPSNILISAVIVGTVLLFTRYVRAGRIVLAISVALIVIDGLSPFGSTLVSILEDRFPSWDAHRPPPTGFIILGGAVEPELSQAHASPALNDAAERITIVAELALRYPSAQFIFSGGNGNMLGGPPEADEVMHLFETFGVPKERVRLERRSRNTYENALFTKELAQPKPGETWVVVTSAYHMPRAIGSFRAVGFNVAAYPVDWRTSAAEDRSLLVEFTGGLGATDMAAHEYIGLFTYWLTGRSSALFPGP